MLKYFTKPASTADNHMIDRRLLLALLCGTVLATSGCFDRSLDEQQLPWSRPADWEGGAPGFGG
jgi:hypothetical protein